MPLRNYEYGRDVINMVNGSVLYNIFSQQLNGFN